MEYSTSSFLFPSSKYFSSLPPSSSSPAATAAAGGQYRKKHSSSRAVRVRLVNNIVNGGGSHDYWGKLVDENMIVLRMRIKEVKMLETSSSSSSSSSSGSSNSIDEDDDDDDDESASISNYSNWMDWEKRYYLQYYNQDVCQAVGLLQSYLLNVRPIFALAFLGLFSFTLPISTVMGLFQAIELVKEFILFSAGGR